MRKAVYNKCSFYNQQTAYQLCSRLVRCAAHGRIDARLAIRGELSLILQEAQKRCGPQKRQYLLESNDTRFIATSVCCPPKLLPFNGNCGRILHRVLRRYIT